MARHHNWTNPQKAPPVVGKGGNVAIIETCKYCGLKRNRHGKTVFWARADGRWFVPGSNVYIPQCENPTNQRT